MRRYPAVMQAAAAHLAVADPTPAGRSAAGILTRWFAAPGSADSDLCFDLGGFGDPAVGDAVRKAVAYAQDAHRP